VVAFLVVVNKGLDVGHDTGGGTAVNVLKIECVNSRRALGTSTIGCVERRLIRGLTDIFPVVVLRGRMSNKNLLDIVAHGGTEASLRYQALDVLAQIVVPIDTLAGVEVDHISTATVDGLQHSTGCTIQRERISCRCNLSAVRPSDRWHLLDTVTHRHGIAVADRGLHIAASVHVVVHADVEKVVESELELQRVHIVSPC